VGYSVVLRAFLFLATKFNQRLPDLRWREIAKAQRASQRRVSERDTATGRREAAAGRAVVCICWLAALVLGVRGNWWLALVVAGWWLVGLAYVAWRVVPIYRRGGRN
jgi:hypothetical protein